MNKPIVPPTSLHTSLPTTLALAPVMIPSRPPATQNQVRERLPYSSVPCASIYTSNEVQLRPITAAGVSGGERRGKETRLDAYYITVRVNTSKGPCGRLETMGERVLPGQIACPHPRRACAAWVTIKKRVMV